MRDPRTDPRTGDVLRLQDAEDAAVYVVTHRDNAFAYFDRSNVSLGSTPLRDAEPIAVWVSWMAAADVLWPTPAQVVSRAELLPLVDAASHLRDLLSAAAGGVSDG